MNGEHAVLKRCKDKCATGEPLTEAEARLLVGRVLQLEAEQDNLEALVELASQSQRAWRKLADSLRDRLKRCQEHNRQAAREVRDYQVAWHRVARAASEEVAGYRKEFAQRAEQAETERDAARAALGRAVDALQCVSFLYHTDRSDTSHDFDTCEACQTAAPALRDPQGQQAAQEWQRLREAAQAVLDNIDDNRKQGTVLHVYVSQRRVEELRAALHQPPPAAEKGQQDG